MTEKQAMEAITREAGQWFALMRGPRVSLADKRAFDQWMEDPANRAEYTAMEQVWQACEGLSDDPEVQALQARRGTGARRAARRSQRFGALAAVAATLVLIVGSVLLWQRSTSYRTGIGEQLSVALDDGSRVLLNTSTEITVDYTPKFRRIALERGQALFTVAHDPARPFVVVARNTLLRAVGTEFDVYLRPGGEVRVAVADGVVQVTHMAPEGAPPVQRRLARGEVSTIAAGRGIVEVEKVAPQKMSSWRTGKLYFDAVPLPEVLAEINRYTERRFSIGDQRLNELLVSAVLKISDQAHFADILESTFPVVALPSSDGHIVLMAREAS